jgi:hypothetical protein
MLDSLPTEIPHTDGNDKDKITEVAEATLATISPPELEPFNISFVDYKEDKCRVDGMSAKNAQIAIKIVRNIGLDFKSHDHFVSKHGSHKLEVKSVFNSPPYDDYYKKLPSEVVDFQEVKEIKYVDRKHGSEVDLRIFYYSLSNIFYMLAITADTHENLNHRPPQNNKKRKWR